MTFDFFRRTYQRKRAAAQLSGILENKEGIAMSDSHDQENGLSLSWGLIVPLCQSQMLFHQFSCHCSYVSSISGVCTEGFSKSWKGRKRKVKLKDEQIGSEEIVRKPIRVRGQATRRSRNNSNTISDDREKLNSTTFLHYFMNLWSTFPKEKVKSVTYLDPLWFNLYANENKRAMVLKWIKEKDIFSKQYVLVPIVIWSHWSLLIICHLGEDPRSKTNGPCMLLLDSLHAIGPTRLEPLIKRLLLDIHKSEEKLESKKQLQKVPLLIPKVPQQKQGEECGFYVLYYIKKFIETAPKNFDQSEGYPYFMKEDWFVVEEVESFCKSLDVFPCVVSDDDHGSEDSGGSVEVIEASC